ncbi:hypothetical protein CQA78_30655, partial [Klebsiella pneumoniae]
RAMAATSGCGMAASNAESVSILFLTVGVRPYSSASKKSNSQLMAINMLLSARHGRHIGLRNGSQ